MIPSLRPYQSSIVNGIRKAAERHKRIIAVGPTGCGKTIIAGHIAWKATQRKTMIFFLVHREEILRQTIQKFALFGLQCGIIQGGKRITDNLIQVAMVQSLANRIDILKHLKNVILMADECHHYTSPTFKKVWNAFHGLCIGLTATPARTDGVGLNDIADTMVIGPSTAALVNANYLVEPVVMSSPLAREIAKMKSKMKKGDFDKDTETENMGQKYIVNETVELYAQYYRGAPVIIFCASVADCETVSASMRAAGWKCETVHGEMDPEKRKQYLYDIGTGGLNAICSYDVISEGVDIPILSGVILRRRTTSQIIYLQQCIDSKTEILTDQGWINYRNINKNQLCATFNDGIIEYSKIDEIIIRYIKDNENMYGIKSPQLDIRVTESHDMIVKGRSYSCKNWIKQTAESISNRKSMFIIPVSGLECIKSANIKDCDISFLGWFLSDGTRNKKTNAICINQSAAKIYHCQQIEKTLTECGLKYGKYRLKRKGEYAKYPDIMYYTISHGKPKKKDKHLKGWEYLEKWIDKSIPKIYESLDSRQFGILLESLNLGDGQNQNDKKDYIPRSYHITTGDNKIMANRLQILCIKREYRCNLATYNYKGIDWHTIHIKKTQYTTISGTNIKNGSISNKKKYKRSRFEKLNHKLNEIVWCVRNVNGTIITRRNGKIAIMGNCGRALRPATGKNKALIIDQVGNTYTHGHPLIEREWSLEGNINDEEKEIKQTDCPSCRAVIMGRPHICKYCGHVFSETTEKDDKPLVTLQAPLEIVHPPNLGSAAIDAAEIIEYSEDDQQRELIDRTLRALRNGDEGARERFNSIMRMMNKSTMTERIWREYVEPEYERRIK